MGAEEHYPLSIINYPLNRPHIRQPCGLPPSPQGEGFTPHQSKIRDFCQLLLEEKPLGAEEMFTSAQQIYRIWNKYIAGRSPISLPACREYRVSGANDFLFCPLGRSDICLRQAIYIFDKRYLPAASDMFACGKRYVRLRRTRMLYASRIFSRG